MRAIKISALIFTPALLLLIVVVHYRERLLFTDGHGDVGQFILQTAEHFGGIPTTTNGLPFISDQWRYFESRNEVVIHLPPKKFPAVETLLKQSFDHPNGWGREFLEYRLSTNGATLYLYGYGGDDVTEVVIRSQPHPDS